MRKYRQTIALIKRLWERLQRRFIPRRVVEEHRAVDAARVRAEAESKRLKAQIAELGEALKLREKAEFEAQSLVRQHDAGRVNAEAESKRLKAHLAGVATALKASERAESEARRLVDEHAEARRKAESELLAAREELTKLEKSAGPHVMGISGGVDGAFQDEAFQGDAFQTTPAAAGGTNRQTRTSLIMGISI